jgi:hypothetical protein
MQIIIPPKKWTDGDIGKAMQRELRSGVEFLKAKEKERELKAAEEAKQMRQHKEIKGLGRCVAKIPEWEFFRMHQKYGQEETHSKEFLQYFQRKFPHLAPHKL